MAISESLLVLQDLLVLACTWSEGELQVEVTASIGVAGFPETTEYSDGLLECADAALYQAKHEGRDRVVLAIPAKVPAS